MIRANKTGPARGAAAWLPAWLLLLPACCATPLLADFSTPGGTLATFQAAFNADAPELEYECFALEFKERRGGFDLEQYLIVRDEALDQNPLISTFMSLKDLSKSVKTIDVDPEGRAALMTIELFGDELRIRFVRETVYGMEFTGDARYREDLMPPFRESIQSIRRAPDQNALGVVIPDVPPAWLRKLPDLRRLILEERWKFADVRFLEESPPPPPQP